MDVARNSKCGCGSDQVQLPVAPVRAVTPRLLWQIPLPKPRHGNAKSYDQNNISLNEIATEPF